MTKGFKGFLKGLVCRDFQFAENTVFEQDAAPIVCEKGFHFCEMPLDLFEFYPPTVGNEFAEIEAVGLLEKEGTKSCTNRISIFSKIGIYGLISAQVKLIWEKCSAAATTGDGSAAATTGYGSAAATTGNGSAAATTGYGSIAAAFGVNSKAKSEQSWIVIADWRCENGWQLVAVHTAKVGEGSILGVKIEPDTWYWFEDGELKSEK